MVTYARTISSTCKPVRGLFITGTDTGVGKTYVARADRAGLACRRAFAWACTSRRPAAAGARGTSWSATMRVALWNARRLAGHAGRRLSAAIRRAAGAASGGARPRARTSRPTCCAAGSTYWLERSDVVVVEGAGGLMSPLGDDEYVADLAYDFGFPL